MSEARAARLADSLPDRPALVRATVDGSVKLALWNGSRLLDLTSARDPALAQLDMVLQLSVEDARQRLEKAERGGVRDLDPAQAIWAASAESQEVWALA